MPMIALMGRQDTPRSRWKTISLRGLLLSIVAIALGLGWIVHKAREQREAVASLQKFGGFVHYDWEFVGGPVKVQRGNLIWKPTWGTFKPGGKPWAPDWLRRAVGDEYFQSIAHVSLFVDIKKGQADATWVNVGPADLALRKLATQTSVRTLQLGGQQVTDENLAYVGQMTGLEELSIFWSFQLTDKGISQLSGLKRLRILEIDNSRMTDVSLGTIGKLTNLEELRIGGVGFSDRGLAQLKGLTRLTELSLGAGIRKNERITDAGLEFLMGMKALERLDVTGSELSDRGLARLGELQNLKNIRLGLTDEQAERRKRVRELFPAVFIE